jgi:hypothetical protein
LYPILQHQLLPYTDRGKIMRNPYVNPTAPGQPVNLAQGMMGAGSPGAVGGQSPMGPQSGGGAGQYYFGRNPSGGGAGGIQPGQLFPGPFGDWMRGMMEKYMPYAYHQGATTPGLLGGGNPMAGGAPQGGQTPFTPGYTFGQQSPNYGYQTNPVGSGWGDMMGGIGSILGSLFGAKGGNPGDEAMKYLEQMSGKMGGYLNPYINAGLKDLDILQGQYGKLINDPGAMMAQFGKSFQQSPGYQFQVDQAKQAVNNAAAAGGNLGSMAEQANMANTINGLANQDYYNYLDRTLGLYGQGLHGMQDVYHTGYGASSQMANAIQRQLEQQAQAAYASQAAKNQQQGGFWGSIGGLAGNLINKFLF